jgi:hypothetical protein
MSPLSVVRIPLQVGLASLWSALRASVFGWLGLALSLSFLWLRPLVAPSGTGIGVGHLVAIAAATLLGLSMLVFWSDARALVRTEAPSDLELGPEGLRVLVGGAAPGPWIAWADVDPDGCNVVEDAADRRSGVLHFFATIATLGLWQVVRRLRPVVQRLQVRTRDGVEHVLARSDDRAEIASFRDVVETVRAIVRDESGPASAGDESRTGPRILACHACNAPLAPADVDVVRCHHCVAETGVPDELRARLRAPADLARIRQVERQLRRLTRRPGAWRARGVLRLTRVAMWLAWPGFVAGWAALYLHLVRDAHGELRVFLLGGAPAVRAAAIAAMGFGAVLFMPVVLAAASLHGRRSLRIVSLRFGAVAPAEPGAPCTCRRCGAPLPEAAGQAAVACVYCGADNVVGDHLLPAARRVRGQAGALRDAFVHRRRARLRVALAVVAAVVAGWGVVRTVEAARARPPHRPLFKCGNASECVEIENRDPRAHALVIRTFDGASKAARATRDVVIQAGQRVAVECQRIGCAIVLELAGKTWQAKRHEPPLAIRDATIGPRDAPIR